MKELKALSYDNLIKLAKNRGDMDLEEELQSDLNAEKYWNEYFNQELQKKEKTILN